MSEPRFGCPGCGSERIREQNTISIDYDVEAWDENGTSIEYGDSEVFYETAEPVGLYWCRECNIEFVEPERLT